MRAFLDAVSAESLGSRFFGTPDLDRAAELLVANHYGDSRDLLVLADGVVIAHGGYVVIDSGRAEAAFLVADAWQGAGIASMLLARLSRTAADEGITTLLAEMRPSNHRMLAVFKRAAGGGSLAVRAGLDAIEVALPVVAAPVSAPASKRHPPLSGTRL